MDNPYAPPIPVAGAEDLSQPRSNHLNLTWSFVVLGGLAASVLSGACVLLYQVLRHWFQWPRTYPLNRFIVPESASFSSAVLFTVLVFATPSHKGHGRNVGFALLCGVAGLGLYATAVALMESSGQFGLFLFLIFFPASQMLTAATICRIHRVTVRPVRLLMGGLLGTGVWFLLTVAAVWMLIKPASHPYDDFAGYTLLTMFWCWTVALQMPLMLNMHLRVRPEP